MKVLTRRIIHAAIMPAKVLGTKVLAVRAAANAVIVSRISSEIRIINANEIKIISAVSSSARGNKDRASSKTNSVINMVSNRISSEASKISVVSNNAVVMKILVEQINSEENKIRGDKINSEIIRIAETSSASNRHKEIRSNSAKRIR